MAWAATSRNHNGAKRGRGYWGRKAWAKKAAAVGRRRESKAIEKGGE